MNSLIIFSYVVAAIFVALGVGRAIQITLYNRRLIDMADEKGIPYSYLKYLTFGWFEVGGIIGLAWIIII